MRPSPCKRCWAPASSPRPRPGGSACPGSVAGDPADLQIMYAIDGTRRLTELELGWLAGYEGSAPVRIGNAAVGQLQLDVWGEVLDGLHVAREAGLAAAEDAWDLQRALLDYLEGHWQEPDNGLWEVRGQRRDRKSTRLNSSHVAIS